MTDACIMGYGMDDISIDMMALMVSALGMMALMTPIYDVMALKTDACMKCNGINVRIGVMLLMIFV